MWKRPVFCVYQVDGVCRDKLQLTNVQIIFKNGDYLLSMHALYTCSCEYVFLFAVLLRLFFNGLLDLLKAVAILSTYPQPLLLQNT
jgi:hypothetical protein